MARLALRTTFFTLILYVIVTYCVEFDYLQQRRSYRRFNMTDRFSHNKNVCIERVPLCKNC